MFDAHRHRELMADNNISVIYGGLIEIARRYGVTPYGDGLSYFTMHVTV